MIFAGVPAIFLRLGVAGFRAPAAHARRMAPEKNDGRSNDDFSRKVLKSLRMRQLGWKLPSLGGFSRFTRSKKW